MKPVAEQQTFLPQLTAPRGQVQAVASYGLQIGRCSGAIDPEHGVAAVLPLGVVQVPNRRPHVDLWLRDNAGAVDPMCSTGPTRRSWTSSSMLEAPPPNNSIHSLQYGTTTCLDISHHPIACADRSRRRRMLYHMEHGDERQWTTATGRPPRTADRHGEVRQAEAHTG